ncbi:MAG: accessory gene regulator B family protein [Lachnospiraceae bacterium]|nr:accessory gene regulator B family protein [Lachnospiraceae bacterium]
MEAGAERIALKLTQVLHQTERETAIYKYQLQVMFEQFIGFSIMFLLAFFGGKTIDLCIFLVVFIPIRSYAGGYHMDTFRGCLVMSNVLVVGVLYSITYVQRYIPPLVMLLLGICALAIIRWMAPVLNQNRPMSRREKLLCKKRITVITILLGVLLLFFYKAAGFKILTIVSETVIISLCMMCAGKVKYKRELIRK